MGSTTHDHNSQSKPVGSSNRQFGKWGWICAVVLPIALALISRHTLHPTLTPLPAYGALTQIANFGSNPTNIGVYAYLPEGLVSNPALIVALHYCTGSAEAFFNLSRYDALADQKQSFMVLYGDAPAVGKCWDVASPASLTHDGGGDSLGIASAVRFVITNWNVNPEKVFVTGMSSGSMMTNVLAGAYPDLFKAGVAFGGVSFGCFLSSNGSSWSTPCALGQLIKTPQEWGDQVRAAYPGYSSARPRMQLWHSTDDDILYYQNFKEEIKA
ncbi:carbohydrate esterase family 1 protein [Dendrothele bispora CBS 962.96]|uniref:Carbohydrate esterase family 1 protein n=1 Tax=Dendrothele bispora (strain CBS 962.96) TaxID=1314807 RepID=A0A4S8M3Z4_DENBC|nr:carbohydrate esterase family 1 protein [Dendrothele bispora CBS 962.96]